MILIADSGSTKTEWVILEDGKKLPEIFTQGINPYFQNGKDIGKILHEELLPKLNFPITNSHVFSETLEQKNFKLYYYGAGCSNSENCNMVKNSLQKVFTNAEITVEHDLLAAARALCGNEKGIAAILGTGSNSCLFDGKNILANNPSLGFLLGDEGSGGHIGKELLKMFVYNELHAQLRQDFIETFDLDKEKILDQVYHKPNPNRYCASFMPFIAKYRDDLQIKEMVKVSFKEFFKRHITKYENYEQTPFNCVGSVALIFKEQLMEVADEFGVKVNRVIKNPMEGLIEFHMKK